MAYKVISKDTGERMITLNPSNLKKLKNAWQEAVKKKKKYFVFEGNVFLTDYAKYLIQYGEMKFRI